MIYYDPVPTGGKVRFTSHSDGEKCPAGEVTVTGESDPTIPLFLDGTAVGRQRGGRFVLKLTLSHGENKFVFDQGGREYCLTLYGTS